MESTIRATSTTTMPQMGPAIPMRLATVYHGDDRVRRLLESRAAEFARALDQVTGRTEWGVKVFLAPAPDPLPAAGGPSPRGAGTAVHGSLSSFPVQVQLAQLRPDGAEVPDHGPAVGRADGQPVAVGTPDQRPDRAVLLGQRQQQFVTSRVPDRDGAVPGTGQSGPR